MTNPKECLQFLTPALENALQSGLRFTPVSQTANDITVQVHNAYNDKTTEYVTTYGTGLWYPTGGRQPTQAQRRLIDPVLWGIGAYNVPLGRLDELTRPQSIQAEAEDRRAGEGLGTAEKLDKAANTGFSVLAVLFLPLYLVCSVLFKTAKTYK